MFKKIFETIFRGSLMLVGAFGCCVASCVGILIAVGVGISINQQAAIELNDGFGTLENPITSGEWVRFEDFSIRITRRIRDGANHPAVYDALDRPAAGSLYTLVWFEMFCRRDAGECSGREFGAVLIDSQGHEWQQPPNILVFTEDDLDFQEALVGNTTGGWQLFERPDNANISLVKLSHNGVHLYVRY